MSKTCSRCKIEKIDEEFYSRGGKQKHLLYSHCKTCCASPERLAVSRERNKKYRDGTLYKRDKQNPARYLWRIARKRALKLGLEFSITPDDIIVNTVCPVLGTELSIGTKTLEYSMSLDRVDNSKGYVPGNVVTISRKANLWKQGLGIQEFELLINYIKEYTHAR